MEERAQLCSSYAFEFVVRDFILQGQLIFDNQSHKLKAVVKSEEFP